jgi:hypothetical protein
MATGASWWFSSGGSMPWTFLNTSTATLPEMSMGYFDGDSRCDVSVGGTLYSGGTGNAWFAPVARLATAGTSVLLR